MDPAPRAPVREELPPKGFVQVTYASSAGRRSGILISHGRIIGLLLGSFLLSSWFVVTTALGVIFAWSPSIRETVVGSLIERPPTHEARSLSHEGAAPGVTMAAPKPMGPETELAVPPTPIPTSVTASRPEAAPAASVVAADEGRSVAPPSGVKSEGAQFDKIQVEVGRDKLEFRFFLKALQRRSQKMTGKILARAKFLTSEGATLWVASTLEGGGVYRKDDPEMGIPFSMRVAVRHDLVFLAPEDANGRFVSVAARAYSPSGAILTSVTIPATP